MLINLCKENLDTLKSNMTESGSNHKKFSVVQFIALPFEGIDDYVCVPTNWIVTRRPKTQKVAVAYPNDEDRFKTRNRVKKEERCCDHWKFWTAELKYQSDTFEDADFWIATRNDYGPFVQQNLSLNDTPSTSALNKKLRKSKQKSTLQSETDTAEMTQKPFQIARKPLPRTTIKRPASDNSQPQLETKRFKQSTAKDAEPTGAVSQSANKESGFSSIPAIIEDGPDVIDIDEDGRLQQDQQSSENDDNSENRLVIDMTAAQNHLQDNGSSSSNFQSQITSVQSLATTSNNQEPRAGNSSNNGPPTSGHQLESIATRLYEKMKQKPSLVAEHPAVEKKMRLENITRNVAILLKNPPNLIHQNQPSQEPRILPPNRTSQFVHPGDVPASSQEIQHVASINIEITHNAFENPRVVAQNIASVVSAPLNLPSSPQLDGHRNSPARDQYRQPIIHRSPNGFNVADRMQELILRQRRNLPIWGTRRTVVPPTLPRSRGSIGLPQETTRNRPSLLFPSLPNSIQQTLLATHSRFLSHEEELQGHLAQGTQIIETHPDTMSSAASDYGIVHQNSRTQPQRVNYSNERNQVYFQDDIDRSPSTSDSGIGIDHDGMFDLGIPTEELLVGTTNNINESRGNPRFISQQQMKDYFASTSAQITSTLNDMVNTFETLRTSILKVAASRQTLLENMERFNSPENLASQASTSRNVAQEVPLVAEEREISSTRNANFTGDQNRNDVVNEAPERNPNPTSRLTLPPEYDPDDTRWTLKHHEHMPGLVELMPHSNIYVNYGELKFCEQTSSNCPSLARRLLREVFNKKALSVCSSMTEKGHDYSIYPDERPKLDEHGCLVLLNYILEHGVQRGWKTDMQPILAGLHDKVKEIRFRDGVMSRC